MGNYPNSRAFTNNGQFLVVEHKAPSGSYGDWTDIENPGTAGSDLGKRAYEVISEAITSVRACAAPLSADWKQKIDADYRRRGGKTRRDNR